MLRGWRAYILVGLIALCAGLFGVGRMPVLDIDEGRFAQATRQMIETDDYVRIRLQDAERNRKPIGVHWLQAATVNTLRPLLPRVNTIWPYRLPSVLGLIVAALAALWAGQVLVGPRSAIIGASLYAASLLAGIEGMTAKTDALMVGLTTLAFAALARLRFSADRPRLYALVFWAAMGAGFLVKGLVTPGIVAMALVALFAWERKAAWLKPLLWWPGPLLALALTAPWLIAIGAATEGRFYTDFLANELGPKIAGADHAHRGAPGYHTLLLPLLIFPATYALPAAARLAWRAIRTPASNPAQARMRFLLTWAVPAFVAFELMPTKLLHYTLPVYPAIALMCAAGLSAVRTRKWRTAHPVGAVMFGVAGALLTAAIAYVATFIPGDSGADLRRLIAIGAIGALVLIAAIVGLSILRRPMARAAILIVCALAFSFTLRDRIMPDARLLFVSEEAVAALTRARMLPRDAEPFWVVGYTQPSLIFRTRTSIRLVTPEDAAVNAAPGDSIVIEGRQLEVTRQALAANGLMFVEVEAPARGIALGRGEQTTLHIGRIATASGEPADAQR
jgi:4-amino-4-deoxy-L-arabinose transferase-like glycosyltransferase